jgi:hypothetical protein
MYGGKNYERSKISTHTSTAAEAGSISYPSSVKMFNAKIPILSVWGGGS